MDGLLAEKTKHNDQSSPQVYGAMNKTGRKGCEYDCINCRFETKIEALISCIFYLQRNSGYETIKELLSSLRLNVLRGGIGIKWSGEKF